MEEIKKTKEEEIKKVKDQLVDILARIVFKFTSGRFILVMTVAAVYAYLAVEKVIPTDNVIQITLLILYAYFHRNRNGESNDNNES